MLTAVGSFRWKVADMLSLLFHFRQDLLFQRQGFLEIQWLADACRKWTTNTVSTILDGVSTWTGRAFRTKPDTSYWRRIGC